MDERWRDLNWSRLIREIRRQQVIPVIGPELLTYHGSLAAQLASQLELTSLTEPADIGTVAEAFVAHGGNVQLALDTLDELLQAGFEHSEWIDKLACIDEFRLYLTTDFDSVIERALRKRSLECDTLAFAPQSRFDDVSEYPLAHTVYHLFGHFERLGRVALTKVDQLEYVHCLQAQGSHIELFDVLRERKNILFLGCDFPEWLTAFFTRILVGNPLYETRMRGMEVVANRTSKCMQPPTSLTTFLRQNRIEIYPGDARQFIAELYERYASSPTSEAKPGVKCLSSASRGHVFVSYSRKDASEARRFVDALRANHIDVWFDERDLESGAPFSDEIKLAIQEDAAAFIPIVSRRALTLDRGFFVREWNWALESQQQYLLHAKFVFPVVLDEREVNETIELLNRSFAPFAKLHIERCASNGKPSDRLVQELREARKRFERSRRVA